MSTSLRSVAGLLGSLNRDADISSVERRKLLQKIVYLAQRLGLPTMYRFNWYIHGPYSPGLARDYYDINTRNDTEDLRSLRLSTTYAAIASKITDAITRRPEDVGEADWAELLASIVFLESEAGYSTEAARNLIQEKKPHVARHYDEAGQALRLLGVG